MIPIERRIVGMKQKEVYKTIQLHGLVSKQILCEVCSLTSSTASRVLEELTAQGLIKEVGLGESSGGRKPLLYCLNETFGYILGLNVSRRSSGLVLCDSALNVLKQVRWPMTQEMTPDQLLEMIDKQVEAWKSEHSWDNRMLIGMGVGAVGPLERERGIIVRPRGFEAPEWEDIPIVQWLEDMLSIPVVLDNGANTALLGEYWMDGSKPDHALYVNAGIGLRSSMISGGNIVYGAVDMEGSVGQMIIQADGIRSETEGGNFGSWDSYASIRALERRASTLVRIGRESKLKELAPDGRVSYAMLKDAMAVGDAAAMELFTESAIYFGIGLANLLNILHPDKVVLGGPLFLGNPMYFEIATRTALEKTYYYPQYEPSFRLSKLGEDAISVGAAALVVRQLWQ